MNWKTSQHNFLERNSDLYELADNVYQRLPLGFFNERIHINYQADL
jgi:hypothetical protein